MKRCMSVFTQLHYFSTNVCNISELFVVYCGFVFILQVCVNVACWFRVMASTGVTSQLPPVKSVVVYRNGDPFFSG